MVEYFDHLLHEFQLPLESPILVFSLILTIILLSPLVLGRLNIPGIIGLIIAGIIIGPHGFHVIENSSAIELFSTIGLLYIMFIAGLELDLNEFKANRNKSLLFGFFTFTIPLALGFPVMYYFLGYDFNASFLTASMFATHTLVTYPIVSKMGVSKNQAVAITVGGTILTDTAVLLILAIIMGNAEGSLNNEFWITLGVSLAIFSVIMFFLIPRIAKWFFKKLEGEKHSHYIFVLSVVFFAAFLAEVAGVEPIIGAFVAGLALNKLIPPASPLMNRIEFLGNSLFIPFFLISVGMLVDVSVIFGGVGAWIIAGTLTAVAVFGKWLASWLTQIIFKFTSAQRQIIFGLSGAHAAATLAIILVGYNAGIIDEKILNGTIILILITSVISSFVTERAAKKIIIESADDVEGLARSIGASSEHILLPINIHDNVKIEEVERLLEFTTLIKDKKSPNPITLLSVVSNNEEAETNLLKSKNELDSMIKKTAKGEIKVNLITTIDYHVATGIARVSREVMSDLIVLGWPRRSAFLDILIGEQMDSIINKTMKTAMVCHIEKPIKKHNRIVIFVPPLAEKEIGFVNWLSKMIQLSIETKIPLFFYCNEQIESIIKELIIKAKIKIEYSFDNEIKWDNFIGLRDKIQENDMLVLILARKGSTSYQRGMEHLPNKFVQYFDNTGQIVIYPQNHDDFNTKETYVSSEPLNRGIDVVQKVRIGLGSLFRKNNT
ncbi:MAG: cation:proton antiporter [Brumimicrobium sp.]